MRSIDTVSKPAARAVSTAARACRRAVTAAEETQGLVREGLHPERQRAHAERPPRGAGLRCHVLGVGLEEDPRRGRREREVRAARVEHARELLGRQLRGRSPAEVHGVEGPRVAPRRARRATPPPPGERRSAGGPGMPRASPRNRSTGRSPNRRECGGRARALSYVARPRRPPSGARPRRPPAGSRPPPPSSSSSCPPSASRGACACG